MKTTILKSDRNRPPELQNKPGSVTNRSRAVKAYREMQDSLAAGISIEEVADRLFKAIEDEQLYVLTEQKHLPEIRERMENILGQKNS